MKLSPRLLRIAASVPEEVVAADVGTDHAYLPVYLVATGRCPRVIASDSSVASLEMARKTLEQFGFADKVDLRLGIGLEVIRPLEAEVVVMAGLGGLTMIDILESDPDIRKTVSRFVLQPMSDSAALRKWLIGNGLRLVDEELVPEGEMLYEIIVSEPGEEEISEDILYEIGPRLVEKRDPSLVPFMRRKLDNYRTILRQVEAGAGRRDQRFWEVATKIQKIEELLKQVH